MPRRPGVEVVRRRRPATIELVLPPSEVIRLRFDMSLDQLLTLGLVLAAAALIVGYQVLIRLIPGVGAGSD